MSFDLPQLRDRLKPFRLHYFPRLRSTNDQAARLREQGSLFAPAVVLTGHQTAGRGRGTHRWWSAAAAASSSREGGGSLTVTFVLPPDDRIEPHQLPLLAGLAARNAAAELAGDDRVQLKWPNDLVYRWKKIGGLLCERVRNADLVGIGLNVNLDPADAPAHLRGTLASLAQIRGEPIDLTQALLVLAGHLRLVLRRSAEGPVALLLREYDTHHALIGRRVRVTGSTGDEAVAGRCEGLDPLGRLLLRDRGQLHHVISGHVQGPL